VPNQINANRRLNKPMVATFELPYLAIALLSKTAPSGVSRTGTCKEVPDLHPGLFYHRLNIYRIFHTFPIGFILRNCGVLLETPI